MKFNDLWVKEQTVRELNSYLKLNYDNPLEFVETCHNPVWYDFKLFCALKEYSGAIRQGVLNMI